MAISYTITKHAVCYPSKLLAQGGGAHIFNVKLGTNADNGNLIALGKWTDLDYYEEGAVTTFSGTIRKQLSNGNWLVEVKTPGDALLVYQIPLIAEDYSQKFKDFANFYNKAGDIVRAYGLVAHDFFEVSAEAFSGTPAVGKTLSVTSKKLVVGADEEDD